MKAIKAPLLVIALLSTTANAALYDRGNGMIYDSTQNITWLQDADYAATSNYPGAGYSQDDGEGYVYTVPGVMNWADATTWASNLVYKGISGWRLPSAKLIGDTSLLNISYDGSTNFGSNNTRSELGHLYYELGNTAFYVSPGVFATNWKPAQWTFVDAGTGEASSFLNVDNYSYWDAEMFHTFGAFLFNVIGLQTWDTLDEYNQAWAVHDGDIAHLSNVPVPAAAWLFGSGLIGLSTAAWRRKTMA